MPAERSSTLPVRSTAGLHTGGRAGTDQHDSPVFEATRRRLTARQAELVHVLVDAAAAEVETVGYDGFTVRSVARRAGVAPATAYNYFSSKDHLLAELLWRRLQTLPEPGNSPDGWADRLREAISSMVLLTTESPAVVDACTVAMLSAHPEVKHLRDRIGAIIHRHIEVSVGPGVDATGVRVLETTFAGALLMAGMGHMPFSEIPEFMVGAARLLVGGKRSPTDPPGTTGSLTGTHPDRAGSARTGAGSLFGTTREGSGDR